MELKNLAFTGNPIIETLSHGFSRTIKDENNNTVASLNVSAYNGHAEMDYAPVARTLFKDEQVPFLTRGLYHATPPHTPTIMQEVGYIDKNLCCFINNGVNDYWFIRGVEQYIDRGQTHLYGMNTPLSRMGTIHCWYDEYNEEGYYSARVFFDVDNVYGLMLTPKNNGMGQYIEWVEASNHNDTWCTPYVLINPDNQNELWERNNNLMYLWIMTGVSSAVGGRFIQRHKAPEDPFFVRWINNVGEWDTWMFSCRSQFVRALTGNEVFEKYNSMGVQTSYRKEAKETISVTSGIQSRSVIQALSMMQYSPLIQLHTAVDEFQKWVPIQIEKQEVALFSNQPTGEIEISFTLPTPQLNK